MVYASRSSRLVGQVIDGLIAAAPMVVAFIVSSLSDTLGRVLLPIAMALGIGYWFFADGLDGGGSYAKQLMNMEVVDARSGEPCTFGQSLVRNLLLAMLGPIDWVFIFGEKHQRLGDMVAGTIVREADDSPASRD